LSLAADTALERIGEDRWRGEVSEDWWIQRGPFGGYVSAFLVRAIAEAVGDPERPLRSFTVHFADAPAAGPADIVVTSERVGRSSSTLSARMEQDGRPVALALAGCGAWRDGEPEWADAQMPEAPDPDDCRPVKRVDGSPRFHERFDIRWVGGGHPGRPDAEARNVAWLRMDPPQPLDHVTVTAMSDGWMPAMFSKLGRFAIVPTFDLTIHFRSRLPVEGEWLLADYHSSFSAGGAWEEDGELWAPDGTLVAQSRQLAMIREPR
jgi:acyl-CoA thioesterase